MSSIPTHPDRDRIPLGFRSHSVWTLWRFRTRPKGSTVLCPEDRFTAEAVRHATIAKHFSSMTGEYPTRQLVEYCPVSSSGPPGCSGSSGSPCSRPSSSSSRPPPIHRHPCLRPRGGATLMAQPGKAGLPDPGPTRRDPGPTGLGGNFRGSGVRGGGLRGGLCPAFPWPCSLSLPDRAAQPQSLPGRAAPRPVSPGPQCMNKARPFSTPRKLS